MSTPPIPGPLAYPAPPGSWTPAKPWAEEESRPPPASDNPDWIRWWNLWVARTCVMACGLGAVLVFMAGSVMLLLLTDPLFSPKNLSDTSPVVGSALVMACYFILAGSFGLGLADRIRKKVRFRRRAEAVLLMVLPAGVAICTGGLLGTVPYVRGILVSLPVMGAGLLAWSAGTSPYSGNETPDTGIFRWGLWVYMAVPLVITGLFEVFNDASKVAGIAVICPTLAFLSVLFIAQGLVAYRLARRRWGPVFRRSRGPDGVTGPANGAAPAPADGRIRRPALTPGALAVLVLIFAVTLAPAAAALFSPPSLHIVKANGHYADGKASYEIQVVNRGGLAAAGQIEVWLENATMRFLAGRLDSLGGFGLWNLSGELHNSSINTRTRLDAVLVFKGVEQDRMRVQTPFVCLTIPMLLPVALAGAALSGARRRRLRGH